MSRPARTDVRGHAADKAAVRRFVAAYGTALAGLAIFVFLLLMARNFATAANLLNVLKHTSFLAILSVGFTFALITAELDLSFAGLCSLAAVVTGGLVHGGTHWPLAVATGLAIGICGGLLNGILVTRLKVPSLIATLGTASIATGLAFMITRGVAFVGRWDAAFLALARGKVAGIPNLALFMVAVVGLGWLVTTHTRLGIHMIATGEAEEEARRAGIATRRMKVIGLTISGAMAGVAAVLLGMTMFEPGRPNVAGSFAGALIIAMLANGLVLMGAPYYIQDIMLGVIVIGSVSVSASVLKKAAFSI